MVLPSGPSNAKKHLQSRISYLHCAATYLTELHYKDSEPKGPSGQNGVMGSEAHTISQEASKISSRTEKASTEHFPMLTDTQALYRRRKTKSSIISADLSPLARNLISDLQGISRKSLIRLQPSMKHTICKRCQSSLRPGRGMTSTVENKSRGGKKPWADVCVKTCSTCETQKTFPINAKRQPRRKDRVQNAPKG